MSRRGFVDGQNGVAGESVFSPKCLMLAGIHAIHAVVIGRDPDGSLFIHVGASDVVVVQAVFRSKGRELASEEPAEARRACRSIAIPTGRSKMERRRCPPAPRSCEKSGIGRLSCDQPPPSVPIHRTPWLSSWSARIESLDRPLLVSNVWTCHD